MRKVTVEMELTIWKNKLLDKWFSKLEYIEGKHLVRLDIHKGVKVAIADLKMKDGYILEDLPLPKEVKILDVFKQVGNKYTCLIKAKADKKMAKIVKLFDLDVIYEPPFYADEDKFIMSFIADNKTSKLMLAALKLIGKVRDIHVHNASFSETSPLAVLTERQKETIVTAKRLGYYEIPRKVTSKKVASELHLSKTTTLEHLRKAEKRLLNFILAGY